MRAVRPELADSPDCCYSPHNMAQMYDILPLWQQGLNGSGQTVALFEFSDYANTNVATFDHQFGISASTQRVPVDDGESQGSTTLGGDIQGECEMDIEIVHAIAPSARVLVYENNDDNLDLTWTSIFNQMVSDDRAQVISGSVGQWEKAFIPDMIVAMDSAFEEAAAQGQSVFLSTGDNGAFGAYRFTTGPDAKKPAVQYPATDPWVTAVGGTSLTQNSDGSYGGEKVWADPTAKKPAGTGGGVSTLFSRPSWQQGPGISNPYSNGEREIPDVSGDADPDTGMAIYTYLTDTKITWQAAGGTSASAPLWGAYTAILNQGLGGPVGFLNPTLYMLGQRASSLPENPYHDVTSGTNLFYPATSGYDLATGWGSFDGKALLDDVKQAGLVPLRPFDIGFKAVVGKQSKGNFSSIKSIKRGKTAVLAVSVILYATPDNTIGVWHFHLSSPARTLFDRQFSDTFHRGDFGQEFLKFAKVKIPKTAGAGSYTFTASLSLNGQNVGSSTATMQVK